MAKMHRRTFLTDAAALAAASTSVIAGGRWALAGDPSFMNNVPDPLLQGKELPSFKFALDKSKGKVVGRSYGKEVTARELPISKGIAGVLMQLDVGVMRELHWHATAAEWAYILQGRVRTTLVDPQGNSEVNDFEPGDVWYFPRGHGHMLECLGNEPCQFVLIFDNGYFSEFGTFSITDWIGHTPKELLAKNFGVPESTFATFPKNEVYFAKGAVPPVPAAAPLEGKKLPKLTHKYRLMAQAPTRDRQGGRLWQVDSRTFPISTTISGAVLELDAGAMRELHWHPNSDEWQYVISGEVSVTLFGAGGRYRIETLQQGDVGYIPQGYGHSIENLGAETCQILIGFNAGVYEAIDLSQWIAGQPVDVLATNFGQPAAVFEKFPRQDVLIAGGEPQKPSSRRRRGRGK